MIQEVGFQKREGQMQIYEPWCSQIKDYVWYKYQKKVTEICSEEKPKLCPDKWILRHGTTAAHDALRVCEFLAKKSNTKIDHPPYTPDLVPAIFGSFQN
jgi:hypothetical protein